MNEQARSLLAQNLKECGCTDTPSEVLRRCELLNIRVLPLSDPAYPPLLREIYDAPRVLYCLGDTELLSGSMTAVVGSRKVTEYGRQAALCIGERLARGGRTVVSGMAKGTDSFAHEGALAGGGPTVAVLGCGADICYPSENRLLREKIIKNGLLLTEYPPGTPPLQYHFPKRNRIISGLSREVIVVEAGIKSGSLITAEQALDQGREVYCVPGSIFTESNHGAHRLLQEGASLLASFRELDGLCLLKTASEAMAVEAPEEVRWLVGCLSDFGTHPEEAAALTGRSPSEVQTAAVLAQTAGAVRIGTDGKLYPVHQIS